jgi:hypothetical protein
MDEEFRLLFKGEVMEGQHRAVVRKRLGSMLKLDEAALERLFSGEMITVKQQVDKPTAARYQQAFKQAGARLRVVRVGATQTAAETPVAAESARAANAGAEPQAAQPSASEAAEQDKPTDTPATGDGLSVLPPGSDVLRPDERQGEIHVEIDTSHLETVEGALSDRQVADVPAPDVSHITLADVGVDISDPQNVMEIEIDVDFDIAEPGADLTITQPKPAPPPPDTSHIKLDD